MTVRDPQRLAPTARQALQTLVSMRRVLLDRGPFNPDGFAAAWADADHALARDDVQPPHWEGARWQPIATAPRDKSDVLVLIPGQKKHHQMVGYFAPDGQFHSWPGRHRYKPTRWMPLPASGDTALATGADGAEVDDG